MRVKVIGIGQSLRGDDAAGLEAVRQWQNKYPKTANNPLVSVETRELPGLELLDMLEGAGAAILVDAVRSSNPPGTLRVLRPEDLAAFTTDSASAHGLGVAETLNLGRMLSPSLADCQVTLIGIEVGRVNMGAGLSAEVEAAVKEIVDLIEKEVNSRL